MTEEYKMKKLCEKFVNEKYILHTIKLLVTDETYADTRQISQIPIIPIRYTIDRIIDRYNVT